MTKARPIMDDADLVARMKTRVAQLSQAILQLPITPSLEDFTSAMIATLDAYTTENLKGLRHNDFIVDIGASLLYGLGQSSYSKVRQAFFKSGKFTGGVYLPRVSTIRRLRPSVPIDPGVHAFMCRAVGELAKEHALEHFVIVLDEMVLHPKRQMSRNGYTNVGHSDHGVAKTEEDGTTIRFDALADRREHSSENMAEMDGNCSPTFDCDSDSDDEYAFERPSVPFNLRHVGCDSGNEDDETNLDPTRSATTPPTAHSAQSTRSSKNITPSNLEQHLRPPSPSFHLQFQRGEQQFNDVDKTHARASQVLQLHLVSVGAKSDGKPLCVPFAYFICPSVTGPRLQVILQHILEEVKAHSPNIEILGVCSDGSSHTRSAARALALVGTYPESLGFIPGFTPLGFYRDLGHLIKRLRNYLRLSRVGGRRTHHLIYNGVLLSWDAFLIAIHNRPEMSRHLKLSDIFLEQSDLMNVPKAKAIFQPEVAQQMKRHTSQAFCNYLSIGDMLIKTLGSSAPITINSDPAKVLAGLKKAIEFLDEWRKAEEKDPAKYKAPPSVFLQDLQLTYQGLYYLVVKMQDYMRDRHPTFEFRLADVNSDYVENWFSRVRFSQKEGRICDVTSGRYMEIYSHLVSTPCDALSPNRNSAHSSHTTTPISQSTLQKCGAPTKETRNWNYFQRQVTERCESATESAPPPPDPSLGDLLPPPSSGPALRIDPTLHELNIGSTRPIMEQLANDLHLHQVLDVSSPPPMRTQLGAHYGSPTLETPTTDPLSFHGDSTRKLQRTLDSLKANLKISDFRPGQARMLHAILGPSQSDVLITLRTGGGKSLLYQTAALVQSEAITLVVQPTISLVTEQAELARDYDIRSIAWYSGTFAPASHLMMDLLEKSAATDSPQGALIFVTAADLPSLVDKLRSGKLLRRVRHVFIDECHKLTEKNPIDWPQHYLPLNVKLTFPGARLVAMSASLTKTDKERIIRCLKMEHPVVFACDFYRPNLRITMVDVDKLRRSVVDDMCSWVLKNHDRQIGIVYCLTRAETESVARQLVARGIPAAPYHACLADQTKKQTHASWKSGLIRVVCATTAFGVGINNPNVRFVIHHSMPPSIHRLYQEIGRAGRDGMPANCRIYSDAQQLPLLVSIQNMGPHEMKMLKHVIELLYGPTDCRWRFILNYFGQRMPPGLRCNNCDCCLQDPMTVKPKTVLDMLPLAKAIRTAVDRLQQPERKATTAQLLPMLLTPPFLEECPQLAIVEHVADIRQVVSICIYRLLLHRLLTVKIDDRTPFFSTAGHLHSEQATQENFYLYIRDPHSSLRDFAVKPPPLDLKACIARLHHFLKHRLRTPHYKHWLKHYSTLQPRTPEAVMRKHPTSTTNKWVPTDIRHSANVISYWFSRLPSPSSSPPPNMARLHNAPTAKSPFKASTVAHKPPPSPVAPPNAPKISQASNSMDVDTVLPENLESGESTVAPQRSSRITEQTRLKLAAVTRQTRDSRVRIDIAPNIATGINSSPPVYGQPPAPAPPTRRASAATAAVSAASRSKSYMDSLSQWYTLFDPIVTKIGGKHDDVETNACCEMLWHLFLRYPDTKHEYIDELHGAARHKRGEWNPWFYNWVSVLRGTVDEKWTHVAPGSGLIVEDLGVLIWQDSAFKEFWIELCAKVLGKELAIDDPAPTRPALEGLLLYLVYSYVRSYVPKFLKSLDDDEWEKMMRRKLHERIAELEYENDADSTFETDLRPSHFVPPPPDKQQGRRRGRPSKTKPTIGPPVVPSSPNEASTPARDSTITDLGDPGSPLSSNDPPQDESNNVDDFAVGSLLRLSQKRTLNSLDLDPPHTPKRRKSSSSAPKHETRTPPRVKRESTSRLSSPNAQFLTPITEQARNKKIKLYSELRSLLEPNAPWRSMPGQLTTRTAKDANLTLSLAPVNGVTARPGYDNIAGYGSVSIAALEHRYSLFRNKWEAFKESNCSPMPLLYDLPAYACQILDVSESYDPPPDGDCGWHAMTRGLNAHYLHYSVPSATPLRGYGRVPQLKAIVAAVTISIIEASNMEDWEALMQDYTQQAVTGSLAASLQDALTNNEQENFKQLALNYILGEYMQPSTWCCLWDIRVVSSIFGVRIYTLHFQTNLIPKEELSGYYFKSSLFAMCRAAGIWDVGTETAKKTIILENANNVHFRLLSPNHAFFKSSSKISDTLTLTKRLDELCWLLTCLSGSVGELRKENLSASDRDTAYQKALHSANELPSYAHIWDIPWNDSSLTLEQAVALSKPMG